MLLHYFVCNICGLHGIYGKLKFRFNMVVSVAYNIV